MPDGPDGVNDVLGWKRKPGRDSGLTSRARADLATGFFKTWSRRSEYRPADAAAPEQAFVGGVHDGIYFERRDVGYSGGDLWTRAAHRAVEPC